MKTGPRCKDCPLWEKPGPVWGEGPLSSSNCFVGLAPEYEECKANKPFVGGAGRILSRGLWKVGLDRYKECFITNMVKCYVPAKTPVPAKAIECCQPLLERELNCLENLKVTVALGAQTFKSLTGYNLHIRHNKVASKKDPKYWLRGAVFRASSESKTCIIGMEHPASVAYSRFLTSPLFEADLEKVKRWSRGKGLTWKEDFNYDPTEREVSAYVQDCIEHGHFGVDIETPETVTDPDEEEYSATKSPIDVIGISHSIGSSMGVPPKLYPLLRPLFESEALCYAFNWGFDGYHLATHYDLRRLRAFCVMLALHNVYSDNSPQDLATALSLFTDMGFHKNLMKTDPNRYNALDTFGALYAGLEVKQIINQLHCNVAFEQDMAALPAVVDLQHKGARCSTPTAERMELQSLLQLKAYEEFWTKNFPLVNWRSGNELLEIFKAKGLPIHQKKRKRKDGSIYYSASLDEEVLKSYRDDHGSQIAALVLEMRTLASCDKFCYPYSEDGYMHARYKLHGTGTGRLSAKSPNPQNIPELIGTIHPRAIIIPDQGEEEGCFLLADFSQIELRIYAVLSNAIKMLDLLATGAYVHGIMFEALFNKPFFEEGMPKQKKYKLPTVQPWELLKAKTVPLGMIYGREVPSLATAFESKAKAQQIYDNFHSSYPEFHQLHRSLDKQVKDFGYLQNRFGRIRRFPNPGMQRNEYLAFPGSSNAADVLRKNALIPLPNLLKPLGARIVLTVHDSIGVSLPKQHKEEVIHIVRSTMEHPVPELNNMSIPVEVSVGTNWYNVETV